MPIGFAKSVLTTAAPAAAPGTNMFLDLFQSNMDTAVTLPTSNNSWVTLKYDDNTFNTNSFITVGAGSDTFTVDETGLYLIQFSCSMTGNTTTVRASHTTRITVNGTAVECGGSSNYPRGASAFDDNNLHIGMLKLNANDVVRCQVALSPYETITGATAYTLNVNNNKAMLTIAKLADNDFCSLGVSSDITISTGKADYKRAIPGGEDDVEWNSQVEVDTASFAHSTGTNPEEITLKSPGKYLITGGILVEKDVNERSTQIFNLKSNDSNYSASGFDHTGIMAASYTRDTALNRKKFAPFCGVIETADTNSKIKFTHHLNIFGSTTEGSTHEVGSNIQIVKLDDVPVGTYRLDTAYTYDNAATDQGIGDDETGQFDTTITQDTGVSRSSNSFTCSSGNYYMVLGNIGWGGAALDNSARLLVDIGVDVSGTGRIPTGFGCQYYRFVNITGQTTGGGDEMSTPFFAIVDATAASKTFDIDIDTDKPWGVYDPAPTGTGADQSPYMVSNKTNQPAFKNSMGIIQLDI